jgi:hypothetical protein
VTTAFKLSGLPLSRLLRTIAFRPAPSPVKITPLQRCWPSLAVLTPSYFGILIRVRPVRHQIYQSLSTLALRQISRSRPICLRSYLIIHPLQICTRACLDRPDEGKEGPWRVRMLLYRHRLWSQRFLIHGSRALGVFAPRHVLFSRLVPFISLSDLST